MADEPIVEPTAEPMQLEGAEAGGTEPTETPAAEVANLDDIVATLDKIGVRDSQHLEGLFHSAQAQGTTGQELGQARAEIERLSRELETVRRTPRQQPVDEFGVPYDQPQGQPIDLRGEMRSVMREFYQDEVIKPQSEAQERYWRDVEAVHNSEYYPMVQEEFHQKVAEPAVVRALQSGKTTQLDVLHGLVGQKFRQIGEGIKSAAVALKEQGPQGTVPPHMEAGQTPPPQPPQGEEARKAELAKIAKESKGQDEDVLAQLKVLIPDDF